MEEYLPFVSIDTWTIIMSWANLLVLFLLLKHFLFKPVKKVLDDRAAEIENTYKAAEDTKSDAEELRVQYETKLLGAQSEADGIIKSAVERADMRSQSIVEEANKKAGGLIEKSHAQIERDREQAIKDAQKDIAVMAVNAAEKLIKKTLDGESDEKLIESIIDKI